MGQGSPHVPAQDELDGIIGMTMIVHCNFRLVFFVEFQAQPHNDCDTNRPDASTESCVEKCCGRTPYGSAIVACWQLFKCACPSLVGPRNRDKRQGEQAEDGNRQQRRVITSLLSSRPHGDQDACEVGLRSDVRFGVSFDVKQSNCSTVEGIDAPVLCVGKHGCHNNR